MRKALVAVVAGGLSVAAIAAYRAGWGAGATDLLSSYAAKPPSEGTAAGQGTPAAATRHVSTASETAAESETNVALSDAGGHVERMTGDYGPGYFGRRLIDGRLKSTWKAEQTSFPREILFSFYERRPVLIASVIVVLPADASAAPKEVEVWLSLGGPDGPFERAAARQLESRPGEQKIAFAAVEARWLKLVILSGFKTDAVEIDEVRVMEAARRGYTPLAERHPDISAWPRSPRDAAQLGLEQLQRAAIDWQNSNKCFGCHVQAQVLMGQAVALRNDYIVSDAAFRELAAYTRGQQRSDGSYHNLAQIVATQFASMGLAYFNAAESVKTDTALVTSLEWLLRHQAPEGFFPNDHHDPPIDQGSFMTSANAAVALMKAHEDSGDQRYRDAATRAIAWVATAAPETTQDEIFKILALSRFGTTDQKRALFQLVQQLRREQQIDGGWKESAGMEGSNAFATGQVLYAFKQAGVSIKSPAFERGVKYLLETQIHHTDTERDGAWPAVHTASHRKSEFAPTMWAVIGLAGAFGTETVGSLQVAAELGAEKPSSRNLEIVLDASGSMKLPLGASTRWQTALSVLDQVVATLPDDFNVGLRAYAHRYPARGTQTCTDTEVVVPIGRLDRGRVLSAARALRPRGETPLIYSILQAPADLKPGGGSVIVITDGEDTCKGDPVAAAARIKASGTDVTLNIVGFTLQGQQVQQQLSALAESTGGRYYGAQSGEQLARALRLATVDRLPYAVFDAAGQQVAAGEAGPFGTDLPPGNYRVVIEAAGERLEEPVTVTAGTTTELKVVLKGDRLAVERGFASAPSQGAGGVK